MSFLAPVLPFLAGGLVGGIVSSSLKKPATTPTPAPLPQATPRANSVVSDALSRRTGSAANIRTGALGTESGTTAKKQLMGT
jgi:hypothetical protein